MYKRQGEMGLAASQVGTSRVIEVLELTNDLHALQRLDRVVRELQDAVMALRMIPVSDLFNRMKRVLGTWQEKHKNRSISNLKDWIQR